uniref:RWP-RK domain-containing protein n=1 Tax=Peronospora matthiolae TaxID=2874970 RepID=A0AAV1UKJ9_9STRA
MASTSADFELSELQKYYHLPLREAARRLGSCEAVVKRVCRRKHIQRWPYRQVSSKLIKIQHLCKYMAHVSDVAQKARIQQKIKQLTQEYLELVGGQVPSELQLTPADVPTLPPPRYTSETPMDPAVLAAASNDDNGCELEDEDLGDASTCDQQLSAYSLRFILSDCTVLETDTGLHYSTNA